MGRSHEKVLPKWIIFLESVNSDQIRELPAKLDKRNDFLEKKLKLSDDEWKTEDADWLIETLDDWVDGLSEEQITKIKSWINPDRNFVKTRLEQLQSFHKWFFEELKSNKTAKELERSFSPWVIDPESVWTPTFKAQMDKKKLEVIFQVSKSYLRLNKLRSNFSCSVSRCRCFR